MLVAGTFHQYQLAARQMIKQGTGGKIIGAASMVAHKSVPLMAPYSTSKWGVRGLSVSRYSKWAVSSAFNLSHVDMSL